jgi:hypothetical protein
MWTDDALPEALNAAARREAIWALVAGEDYEASRGELGAIIIEEPANEDSLWAEITLELVELLDEPAGIMNVGNGGSNERLTNFHDRLHQMMGRQTDAEVLATPSIPTSHQLAIAYPNPFNSTVTILFEVLEASHAKLDIYNLLGQTVATVFEGQLDAGMHTRQWNAGDIPSGVFFYRYQTGKHVETHKLLLLK